MSFKVINGLRTIEFGTPGKSREELTNLVVNGNKRATASLALEYEEEREPIEHVGEELILIGNEEIPLGKIKVTEVTLCKFAEVPDRFPIAEAEGDRNADEFRAGHKRYWEKLSYTVNDDTMVVLVYFELL
jgi:uncharacterized protein YhfF